MRKRVFLREIYLLPSPPGAQPLDVAVAGRGESEGGGGAQLCASVRLYNDATAQLAALAAAARSRRANAGARNADRRQVVWRAGERERAAGR
jgi:hypothetical protein